MAPTENRAESQDSAPSPEPAGGENIRDNPKSWIAWKREYERLAEPRPAIAWMCAQQHPTRNEISRFFTEHKHCADSYGEIGWTVTPLYTRPVSHYVHTATASGAAQPLEAAKPDASHGANSPEEGCIAPLSAEGMEEQVRLWEEEGQRLLERVEETDKSAERFMLDERGRRASFLSRCAALRTHLQSHPGRAK